MTYRDIENILSLQDFESTLNIKTTIINLKESYNVYYSDVIFHYLKIADKNLKSIFDIENKLKKAGSSFNLEDQISKIRILQMLT
jgi:hypothetical protein